MSGTGEAAPQNRCAELLRAVPCTVGLLMATNLGLYIYSVIDEQASQRYFARKFRVFYLFKFVSVADSLCALNSLPIGTNTFGC